MTGCTTAVNKSILVLQHEKHNVSMCEEDASNVQYYGHLLISELIKKGTKH